MYQTCEIYYEQNVENLLNILGTKLLETCEIYFGIIVRTTIDIFWE